MKRPLALLLILLLPPAIYFPTLGRKRNAELRRTNAQLSALEPQIAQMRAARTQLPMFRFEVDKLGEELVRLRENSAPPSGLRPPSPR